MNRLDILVLRRFVPTILLFASFLIATGCQQKGPKNLVEGKVTFKGGLVEGTVTFLGPDGKSVSAPIGPDGIYHIADPSLGENKIGVAGLGAPGMGSTKADMNPHVPGSKKTKGMEEMKTSPGALGVAPPAKYKDPEKSGLSYNVKGGKEKKDLDLP